MAQKYSGTPLSFATTKSWPNPLLARMNLTLGLAPSHSLPSRGLSASLPCLNKQHVSHLHSPAAKTQWWAILSDLAASRSGTADLSYFLSMAGHRANVAPIVRQTDSASSTSSLMLCPTSSWPSYCFRAATFAPMSAASFPAYLLSSSSPCTRVMSWCAFTLSVRSTRSKCLSSTVCLTTPANSLALATIMSLGAVAKSTIPWKSL